MLEDQIDEQLGKVVQGQICGGLIAYIMLHVCSYYAQVYYNKALYSHREV